MPTRPDFRPLAALPGPGDAQVAPTAALLADPARAAMLLALSDGWALPAGALAQVARVSAPAASAHLARSCYDHLAGTLGVGVTEALVAQGALRLEGRAYAVTAGGVRRFAELGVDVAAVAATARPTRRPLTRACLDWSERRYHLAGALGAALLEQLLAAGWVERMPASRALRVTNRGRRALHRELEVRLA